MTKYNVAVVGATGLVGRKMVEILEQRNFPIKELHLFASERSEGKEITVNKKTYKVKKLTTESFKGIDFALFSAGASISKDFAPAAVESGAIVIDNSSQFRLKEDIPLIVPEVNSNAIKEHKGIIANPNCSTIQLVMVLSPLNEEFNINRVVVSTYQSVTGKGNKGLNQLQKELAKEVINDDLAFPHIIAYNAIPQVDVFVDGGYTKEEIKMMHETRKILNKKDLKITATCVRIPTVGGHGESVNIEFDKKFRLEDIRHILSSTKGIKLVDEPHSERYPMPIHAMDKDEVFVGRIRIDNSVKNTINLWIVSDNLRKGAATNAVQIAEEIIKGHNLKS